MDLKFLEVFSAFMVLFAVIDIFGSIPLILAIKSKGGKIKAGQATLAASLVFIAFHFLGEQILHLFNIDISSFAIAGSVIILFLALEMVMGIEFFKTETSSSASIVPIAFPIIAGAGSMTTLISIRAEYSSLTILIAIALNMIIVFLVLRLTHWFERILGEAGILILKKFFGIILLAIAIKLFTSNTGIKLG